MYVPKPTEETRVEILHDLIRAHPFAALVAPSTDGLIVNHMPFLVDKEGSKFGTLRAHVARANPVWQQLSNAESVVIFQGPHAYTSPNWYASKREHGKVVPTWSYAVVHAHGKPRAIEDAGWLLNLVTTLTDLHETSQPKPWKVSDAPRDYIDKLVERIVGIEMPITNLVGKWKFNQARPTADNLGTIAGLNALQTDAASEVAAIMVKQMDEKRGT